MGAAIAGHLDFAGLPREHQTMSLPFNPAESAKTRFAIVEAFIDLHLRGRQFKRSGINQRPTMFCDVESIFRGVDHDVNAYSLTEIWTIHNFICSYV